jgi:hypothetical protein
MSLSKRAGEFLLLDLAGYSKPAWLAVLLLLISSMTPHSGKSKLSKKPLQTLDIGLINNAHLSNEKISRRGNRDFHFMEKSQEQSPPLFKK